MIATPNMDELLAEFRAAFPAAYDGRDPMLAVVLEMAFLLGANMTLARLDKERAEGGESAASLAHKVLGIESALRFDGAKRDALTALLDHERKGPQPC